MEDVGFVLQYIYHPRHREKDEILYKNFPKGWRVSLRKQVTLRVYEEEFWGPIETLDEIMEYIRGVYEDLVERKIIAEFRLTVV
jgi:hypothetical protein